MTLTKMAIYAAIAAAIIAAYFGWASYQQGIGYDKRQAKQTAADLGAIQENFRISERRTDVAAKITKAKDDEIRTTNTRLVAALDELRNRPERRSAAAGNSTNCQGTSGAELSRPDAGFLAGEAARGDTLRAGLQACYAQYDSLTAP